MKHGRITAGSFAAVLSPLAGIAASLTGALPASGGNVLFTERVISTSADGASSVRAADLDGDGDIDVISASYMDDKIAWYENDGASPPNFTERVISTTADFVFGVFAVDLNGDGDIDVLSASRDDDKIAWYENDGGSPPSFTERVISTTRDGAITVFATDLDGDGDIDVISASVFDGAIAWYENDGASPPSFTERVVSIAAFPVSVFATDLDGDGDVDILSASSFDDTIAWYVNDGGSPPSFTEREISTTTVGAASVFATDVDGDGDTDIVSAAEFGHEIAWHENDGGTPPIFTQRLISISTLRPLFVFAADVDGDGDIDVLSAAFTNDKIAWFENDGGSPPAFTERVISTSADGAISVIAVDLDGDGDTDVLSASHLDDKIAWYENTTPPCGDGTIDPGEECEGGLGCSNCVCSTGFEPMTPPSVDCRPVCGNGIVDAGEECDGANDSACPGACLSNCTCGPFCGDGVCGQGEDACNCSDDCGAPASNEVQGSTCDDGQDNDCDGLTDSADPDCAAIPTVSAWGLVVMALLLLAGAKLYFNRRLAPWATIDQG